LNKGGGYSCLQTNDLFNLSHRYTLVDNSALALEYLSQFNGGAAWFYLLGRLINFETSKAKKYSS